MSGGIRTSVKGYTKVKRGDLAVDTTHENTERDNAIETTFINRHSSNAPQLAAAADYIDKKPANQDSPLNPPRGGLNSNVRVSSVSVPSTPQIEGEILQPFNWKRFCIDELKTATRNFRISKELSVSVTSTPRTEGGILQSSNLKSFAFNELKTATMNFGPPWMVDEGRFSSVYKGWVDENSLTPAKPGTGMVIAVMRLFQRYKEWLMEINLRRLHHENLVRLIGYCLEYDQSLLVYEFMPCGSLEYHLFGRASSVQPLSWNLRMKIAFGAAKGLAFLHSDEAKVIFRDLKSSKILLDSTYNAKLFDFGLAMDRPAGDESIFTDSFFGWCGDESYETEISMTECGYEAPEYISTGHVSAKSDVYSFGVVMLELLSGRRALDRWRLSEERNLVKWAKPYLASKRKVIQIFDGRIEGQYSLDEALRAVNLAIRCLAVEPKSRPTMDDVVKALEQLQEPSDSEGSGREKKGKGGKRNRKKKVEGSG